MGESLGEQIVRRIEESAELYHRLTLVVGPPGGGKTSALQDVSKLTGAPLVNINLELARRLLDLSQRQRALQLPRLLDEILAQTGRDLVLMDNIEILFDVALKQDPLRLLQGISRNRTIVAAWNGSIQDRQLTYASREHPEFRRYPVRDFLVASSEAAT